MRGGHADLYAFSLNPSSGQPEAVLEDIQSLIILSTLLIDQTQLQTHVCIIGVVLAQLLILLCRRLVVLIHDRIGSRLC